MEEAINTVYANTNVYLADLGHDPWDSDGQSRRQPIPRAAPSTHFTTTMLLEGPRLRIVRLFTADGDNWFWSDLRSSGTPVKPNHTPSTIPNLAAAIDTTALVSGDLLGYSANTQHSAVHPPASYLYGYVNTAD